MIDIIFERNFSSLGDLYDEEQILQWLMTQKDPSGDMIEALEGEELLHLIRESKGLAVYFCEYYANCLPRKLDFCPLIPL